MVTVEIVPATPEVWPQLAELFAAGGDPQMVLVPVLAEARLELEQHDRRREPR